jgi:outer membrane protein assembly factor BamB
MTVAAIVDMASGRPIVSPFCRRPQSHNTARSLSLETGPMGNSRFVGVLAALALIGAGTLSAQSASGRSEELARAMARIGVERVFSAYAVDYGASIYGAWVAGHDLYLEQFHNGCFEVIALDLRTGERKWVVRTGPHRLKAAPYPGDRYVALMTEVDGGLVVVNRASGAHEFRMRAEMNTPTTFPAASSDSTVYLTSLSSNGVAALSPADGRSGWRYPSESLLTTGPIMTPRLPRRLVVVGALDGTVTALPAAGWNEEPPKVPTWSRRLYGAVNALTVGEGIDQGRRTVSIVASCEDRGLYCLDSTSGEPRWVYRGETPFKEVAVVSGGIVFARAGRLVAVDLATGKDKWKAGDAAGAAAPWEKATAGYAADEKRAFLRREPKEIARVSSKTGELQVVSKLSEFDYILAAPEANMLVGVTTDGYVVGSK